MTPNSADILRMSFTTVRTQSCGAWLILRRKILAPAKIKARSLSGESVAGPSVQMILVFRMAVLDLVSDFFVKCEWKEHVLFRSLAPCEPERKEEDEKQETTQGGSERLVAARRKLLVDDVSDGGRIAATHEIGDGEHGDGRNKHQKGARRNAWLGERDDDL